MNGIDGEEFRDLTVQRKSCFFCPYEVLRSDSILTYMNSFSHCKKSRSLDVLNIWKLEAAKGP